MAEGERDDTGEWVLPAAARPATLAQLEQRIDHALAVAKASEAAALEIGSAAIDAAEQARRAAELAERASARLGGEPGAVSVNGAAEMPAEPGLGGAPESEAAETGSEAAFDSFKQFLERADRVSARLESLAPQR